MERTPAWHTPADRADRVELFSLPARKIVAAKGWPDTFWAHVGERREVSGDLAQRVVRLFRELEQGTSKRCHMPPWGLALYEKEVLLLTTTLCFMCSNAFVYMGTRKVLRAFNSRGSNAIELREALQQQLPIVE